MNALYLDERGSYVYKCLSSIIREGDGAFKTGCALQISPEKDNFPQDQSIQK